jgi:AsmA protein
MGTGSVDLRQETLDLALTPRTKNTSPLALHSTLYIRGSFAQPKISINKQQMAARAVGAVALGMLSPLLGLLPLIDAGPGKDSDCSQLMRDARAKPQAVASPAVSQM